MNMCLLQSLLKNAQELSKQRIQTNQMMAKTINPSQPLWISKRLTWHLKNEFQLNKSNKIVKDIDQRLKRIQVKVNQRVHKSEDKIKNKETIESIDKRSNYKDIRNKR